MEVTAKLNNLRVSPRKTRLVADLIRGLGVKEARIQLSFLIKRSSSPMLKLLNSAAANAQHNLKLNPDEMYVSRITVDGGPVLKRTMPRAMGRAFIIRKRTSHIKLTLSEKKDKQKTALKEQKETIKKKMPEEIKEEKINNNKTAKPAKDPDQKTVTPKKRLTGLSRRAFISKSK